ncbi:alpha/beta-hydrolase [Trichoderma chlorosporum]
MASYPVASCCFKGVKHEGEATGKSFKIGNYDAYLATPEDNNNHQGAGILYLSDVFGIWANSQLIADQYAANGYTTLIIDILNGDALTEIPGHNFDWMKWLMGGFRDESTPHTNEYVDPAVEEAIKYMRKELKITAIGAVGYCFGAKYVARHSGTEKISVGYMAHPSNVDEDEIKSFQGPLSIAAAEHDDLFPTDLRYKTENLLKTKDFPYQINLFSGVSHGFGVRGDLSNPVFKWSKEQAFLQAIAWFDQYLVGVGRSSL